MHHDLNQMCHTVSFQGYVFYQSTIFGGIKKLIQAKDSSQIGQQDK